MTDQSAQHIRVEYDYAFFGGEYDRVGSFAYVPMSLVEKTGDVEAAFKQQTGTDPVHIVNYSLDEIYDASGRLIPDVVSDDLSAPPSL